MSVRPCPICQHEAPRMLKGITELAAVVYYRCDACGSVWHVPKDDPDGPPVIVTDSRDSNGGR